MTKPELLNTQTSIATTDIVMVTDNQNETKTISGQDLKKDLSAVGRALVCSTTVATVEKVVTGPDITLEVGISLKIIFAAGNTAADITINYNNAGALALKIYRAGIKITPDLTRMQAGVILEVYYDGTDWVIMGNPVIASGDDYTIYADGWNENKKNNEHIPLSFTNDFNSMVGSEVTSGYYYYAGLVESASHRPTITYTSAPYGYLEVMRINGLGRLVQRLTIIYADSNGNWLTEEWIRKNIDGIWFSWKMSYRLA